MLRLFHRYVTIMNFGTFVGGSMGIHKKTSNILDQIVNEVNEKGIKKLILMIIYQNLIMKIIN